MLRGGCANISPSSRFPGRSLLSAGRCCRVYVTPPIAATIAREILSPASQRSSIASSIALSFFFSTWHRIKTVSASLVEIFAVFFSRINFAGNIWMMDDARMFFQYSIRVQFIITRSIIVIIGNMIMVVWFVSIVIYRNINVHTLYQFRTIRSVRFIVFKYVKEFQVYIVRARSYISEYGRTSFSSSCYQSRKRGLLFPSLWTFYH